MDLVVKIYSKTLKQENLCHCKLIFFCQRTTKDSSGWISLISGSIVGRTFDKCLKSHLYPNSSSSTWPLLCLLALSLRLTSDWRLPAFTSALVRPSPQNQNDWKPSCQEHFCPLEEDRDGIHDLKAVCVFVRSGIESYIWTAMQSKKKDWFY